MKLKHIKRGKMITICTERTSCQNCPLYRNYPLAYDEDTNKFIHCLKKIREIPEVYEVFKNEKIKLR